MARRIFGKGGPMLLDKNVGRSYGGTGKRYPAHGAREARRAAMRLAASSPPSWPGLSRPSTPFCVGEERRRTVCIINPDNDAEFVEVERIDTDDGGKEKDVDGRDKPGHDEGEGDRARAERLPA